MEWLVEYRNKTHEEKSMNKNHLDRYLNGNYGEDAFKVTCHICGWQGHEDQCIRIEYNDNFIFDEDEHYPLLECPNCREEL